MDNYWVAVAWSLLPTTAVSIAFFYVVRSVVRMDRTERRAYAKVEDQERARRGMPARTEPATASASVESSAAR